MVGAVTVTLIGNLAGDPEVRNVGGSTVANFSVAVGERKYNRETSEYEDAGVSFYRCAAWRELGDHIASSLHKGDRVIVQGTMRSREYERDNQKQVAWEVECDEAGASLKYATASVSRAQRGQQSGRGPAGGQQNVGRQRPAQQAADQAWSTPGAYDDETPF